jgi:hypothetical protein
MKKRLVGIIAAVLLIIFLAGCAEDTQRAMPKYRSTGVADDTAPEDTSDDITDLPRAPASSGATPTQPQQTYDETQAVHQEGCIDTDDGLDYFEKGRCRKEGTLTYYYDSCESGKMKEMMCDAGECKRIEKALASISNCAGCFADRCYSSINELRADACAAADCPSNKNCIVTDVSKVYSARCELKSCSSMGYTLCSTGQSCSQSTVTSSDSSSSRVCCTGSCTSPGGTSGPSSSGGVDLYPERTDMVLTMGGKTNIPVWIAGENDLSSDDWIHFYCQIPSLDLRYNGMKRASGDARTAAICVFDQLGRGGYEMDFVVNYDRTIQETNYFNNDVEFVVSIS